MWPGLDDVWYVSRLPWLFPALGVAVVVSTVASPRFARWLRVPRPVAWVLIMNVGIILAGTVTPLAVEHRPEVASGTCDLSRIGIVGLAELRRPTDALGNVAMFVPLGLVIALAPRTPRKVAVLLAAAALPVAIETTQLLASSLGRACQSADVADNLTGLAIGFAAGTVLAAVVPNRRPAE